MNEFDDWRNKYNQLSFADNRKYHETWAVKYPTQIKFSPKLIELIDQHLLYHPTRPQFILEIGGWKGELAQKILAKHSNIGQWRNIDIVSVAETETICHDPRYKVEIVNRWIWDGPPIIDYDVVVMSHVLEHMTYANAEALLQKIQYCRKIVVEIPIPAETKPNWNGYLGAHILNASQKDMIELFAKYGFYIDQHHDTIMSFVKQDIIFSKPLRIMVCGWFRPDKYGAGLSKEFEAMGHTVIRVSLDWEPKFTLDPKIDEQPFLDHEEIKNRTGYFKLKPYVEKYPDLDLIIIGQPNTWYIDVRKIYVPIAYYIKDLGYPLFPRTDDTCNIIAWFYSYVGAKGKYYWLHHIPFLHKKCEAMLPYATDSKVFVPDSKVVRDIFIGFIGEREWKTDRKEFEDPQMVDIYNNRKRFLDYVEKQWHAQIIPRDWTFNALKTFTSTLNRINICINIPGNWGKINERQFTAPSMGCVLLQWNYPELAELGFVDRVNCLLFTTEDDLDRQLTWAKTHPEELEQIRLRGMELVNNIHTWKQRAIELLKTVKPHLARQKQRLLTLKARNFSFSD